MRPEARIAATIELLDAVEAAPGPADRLVASWLRGRRFIGAKDRRAILERLYFVLRHRAALDWWRARAAPDLAPSPRARVIAALVLSGEVPGAELGPLFSGTAYAPAPLDEAEAQLAQALSGHALDHPNQPRSVRGNCPDWLDPYLGRRFGERLETELAALNEQAAVDLRVNTLKTTRDAARAALVGEGIETEPTPFSPVGLRLRDRRPLGRVRAYRDGLVEVQDEGAQIVSLLTGARPGMAVADYCAGAGGKALALAARMENRGRLLALDVSPRIARAAPRIERAGASVIELAAHGEEGGWPPEALAARFDRVLLDVPCTGTGTWRRDPAARWRLEPAELERLCAVQRRILTEAAPLVAPGGRLVYATCSLLCEEDEDQADWFAVTQPAFARLGIGRVWAEEVGGECPASDPYLLLTPARHGTDGFFVAVFERRGS
jgi:16S rRNA (cytosine967-C5)-methyltransferase